jgi:hypothetical protein
MLAHHYTHRAHRVQIGTDRTDEEQSEITAKFWRLAEGTQRRVATAISVTCNTCSTQGVNSSRKLPFPRNVIRLS